MLTIWDLLFLSFFIPPNLWDNKKRRCEFIFSDIFSYYTYFTILKFKMEVHLPGEFQVFFRPFSGDFQSFFCSFFVFFSFFFVRKALFYKNLYFFVENCRFWLHMKIFSFISYNTILTLWWCTFQLSFSVLFAYHFRTFCVPFN